MVQNADAELSRQTDADGKPVKGFYKVTQEYLDSQKRPYGGTADHEGCAAMTIWLVTSLILSFSSQTSLKQRVTGWFGKKG